MAIYGHFGAECRIIRPGTLKDVRTLDKRRPDKRDRDCVSAGSYWVVEFLDPKMERTVQLYHLAYLRADGGIKEIMEACRACTTQQR